MAIVAMENNPYNSPQIPAVPRFKERVRIRRIVIATFAAVVGLSLLWVVVFFAQTVSPDRRYIDLSNPDAPKQVLTPAEKLQEMLP
ncbi:MAG TPA: hypothetical protein VL096_13645 [Pirellulaceae bacterium]|nr:hypothetical protein [Pirellulaceae bacterium]